MEVVSKNMENVTLSSEFASRDGLKVIRGIPIDVESRTTGFWILVLPSWHAPRRILIENGVSGRKVDIGTSVSSRRILRE